MQVENVSVPKHEADADPAMRDMASAIKVRIGFLISTELQFTAISAVPKAVNRTDEPRLVVSIVSFEYTSARRFIEALLSCIR